MLLEVIGKSVEDVIEAEKFGADRIEFCQNMAEGGLTPSIGLVEAAVQAVDIPINVMVRPHSKSFVYNAYDIDVMLRDIRAIKQTGANGVVFGALTQSGKVDEAQLKRLLEAAEGMDVTFHRAFDAVEDQSAELETILKYDRISTILTSGGADKATGAVQQLAALVERTKNTSLTIMPGTGLVPEEIADFHEAVQSKALHFGSGVRIDSSYDCSFSENRMEQVRKVTT